MKPSYPTVFPRRGLHGGPVLLALVLSMATEPVRAQEAVRVTTIPQTEIVALAAGAGQLYAASFSHVYRSNDGGATWTQTSDLPVDAVDLSTLIAHNGILYVGTSESGVYTSSNGGDSWASFNSGLTGSERRITRFAVRGDSLYAATDGAGVQVMNLQNPAGWQSFNQGLTAVGITSLAASGDVLVAGGGTTGSVYVRTRQATTWTAVALDPQDPQNQVYSFLASAPYLIAGTSKGIYRSAASAESWISLSNTLPASSDVVSLTQYGARTYAAVLQQGYSIYSSDNQGATWTLRSQGNIPIFDLMGSRDRLWMARADGLWYFDLAASPALFQATLMTELLGQPVNRGSMLATLEEGVLHMYGYFRGLTAPWIQVEIYNGTPDDGEIIMSWFTVPEGGGFSGSLHGNVPLTEDQQQDLFDGHLYLYIRTLGNTSQNIGGPVQVLPMEDPQLLETSVVYLWRGSALSGGGNVLATLEGNDLRIIGFAMFDAVVGQVSLYQGALGEQGEHLASIYLDFGTSTETSVGFDHTLPLSEELKQSLLDGLLYLDFTTYGTTRARAQLLLSPNQAPAASQITAPSAGTTIAIGGAEGQDPLDPETPLAEIAFTMAGDPDGNTVSYFWQASRMPEFGVSNMYTREVGPGHTTFPLTVAAAAEVFDSMWTGLSIPLQTPVTIYHRMITTDGARYTYGETATVTFVRGTITAGEQENDLPVEFKLHGNYPNPFNPSTTVVFDLPGQSDVSVEIFDLLGRQVLTVPAGSLAAGVKHRVEIDGSSLSSGNYIYRVLAESENGIQTATGKMMLIK